jgi:type II secretory ATPase GspE/PulE/Tfp pilus assembly ATPase PilB-like protein
MIGEIRDLETAEMPYRRPQRHLVFSTLHTNDAPSAITRLLDMGVESFLLSSTVRGILAQRPQGLCLECKVEDVSTERLRNWRRSDPRRRPPVPGQGLRGLHVHRLSTEGWGSSSGSSSMRPAKAHPEEGRRGRDQGSGPQRRDEDLLEDGIRKIEMGSTTLGEVFRVTQED